MNLSFAGCGFLGIYHVGVAVCLKQYAPHLYMEKICGASVGAIAATGLLCDMPLGEMTSNFFRIVNEARSHSLRAFSPSFNIQTCLLEGLEKFLPENAHEIVSGRLHISMTRSWDRKNVIVSEFSSREDLLQAILCACWIPCFSGFLPPKYKGERYMDGAFSNNLPILDQNTITVSPFCGESDICPRDKSAQLFHLNVANTSIELSLENIYRFRRILMPPKPEELSRICQRGFDDALQFLHRNNLINCTRCLAVQSTFVVQKTVHDNEDYDPECVECVNHRKDVMVSKMPDTVLQVFHTYIEAANIGLTNWLMRNRGFRLLHMLSLPAVIPAELVCATLTKLLIITNNLASILGDTVERRHFKMMVLAKARRRIIYNKYCYLEELCDDDDDDNNDFGQFQRAIYTAPSLGDRFWRVSCFFANRIRSAISNGKNGKVKANISCQLALTECGKQQKTGKPNISHRSSKFDIFLNENEILSTNDGHHINSETVIDIEEDETIKASPSPLLILPNEQNLEELNYDLDAFENILAINSQQEAVYAYYYMDENNKVNITEIFDMTDSEDPSLQSAGEREINQQLEFDTTDWDRTPTPTALLSPTLPILSSGTPTSTSDCHVCLKLNWESLSSLCIKCTEDHLMKRHILLQDITNQHHQQSQQIPTEDPTLIIS